MKNYLVGAIRPVLKVWGYWKGDGEDPEQKQNLKKYHDMYQLSRASARKFLTQPYEEILFQAPVLDNRLYQIAQWYCIKELWFKEPCNILWMGADAMFVQPTEVFGRYNEMRLFNYTDPKSFDDIPHYFNDDIRYYPATMDPKVWEVGERRMPDWFAGPDVTWDAGQKIHNYQFWSQQISIKDALQPAMAWQAFSLSQEHGEAWNNCALKDAHILHFHGSRGTDQRVTVMSDLCHQLKINTQEEIK